MSRIASVLVARIGMSLSGLCIAAALSASGGGAAAASIDECPPPTTVTVGPDGNPWHG
ncbi:MAG: hypothetical protein HOV94_08290 [Saccharothrix sp.]|nr:hypothetical protein [Saccharothrix sp.]